MGGVWGSFLCVQGARFVTFWCHSHFPTLVASAPPPPFLEDASASPSSPPACLCPPTPFPAAASASARPHMGGPGGPEDSDDMLLRAVPMVTDAMNATALEAVMLEVFDDHHCTATCDDEPLEVKDGVAECWGKMRWMCTPPPTNRCACIVSELSPSISLPLPSSCLSPSPLPVSKRVRTLVALKTPSRC